MISMCVALDMDAGFGSKGTLPWNIPEEFKFYKDTVRDSVCIMGRKTFNDLVGMSVTKHDRRLYKDCLLRTTPHIVVSSLTADNYDPDILETLDWMLDHPHKFVNSVPAALALAKHLYPEKDIFFAGGRSIYEEGLRHCDQVITSIIPATYLDVDTFFPYRYLLANFVPAPLCTIHSKSHGDIKTLTWSRKM